MKFKHIEGRDHSCSYLMLQHLWDHKYEEMKISIYSETKNRRYKQSVLVDLKYDLRLWNLFSTRFSLCRYMRIHAKNSFNFEIIHSQSARLAQVGVRGLNLTLFFGRFGDIAGGVELERFLYHKYLRIILKRSICKSIWSVVMLLLYFSQQSKWYNYFVEQIFMMI